ncbi:iron uptake porin [Chamaesiphon sp. VAR_69_metabat_338]|uniref:iron uptake porin n=1 Tax=Chamaesiphon sp. VAR_69_metabat_338 TaxID=2964704 RepID=UPI00286DE1BB|nr:iron uptake porin [Chamaesiphon sp. VAR_69_metabat_338]
MTNILSKIFISPIFIATAVWIASLQTAMANPTNSPKSDSVAATNTEATAEQIEQATQATEVRPGDWAYQTLQALGNKYSCGNTPTSNKTLSREEFATSLNGCVQSIEQLVARRKPRRAIKKRRYNPAPAVETAPSTAPEVVSPPPEPAPVVAPPEPQIEQEEVVSQQDLDRLKGLVQSFSAELQGVDTRLVALDEKVTKLKDQAFSTTTKLNAEAILGISGYNTGRGIVAGSSSTVLSNRVRLNFDASFMGKDRLRVRLQSRNTPNLTTPAGTRMARLGYDGDEANQTNVSLLQYSYPLSPQTKIIAETVGSEFNENMYTFNPILASSGEGSISRFGRFNPIYRLSGDGASLTLNHKFSDALDVAVGYAVPGAASTNATTGVTTPAVVSNPGAGTGLFNGANAIIGQLNFRPANDLNLGLIYARSYGNGGIAGGTGSAAADNPFNGVATTANHYSFLASYKISPNFVFSGWAGFIEANREVGGGSASVSNYAISLAFPDLGQKGNNLAFIFGIPPKLNSRSTAASPDNSTSYHLEALYKVKLNDNLAITPGILLITNPEHNSANPTEYVGTIRTTFKF